MRISLDAALSTVVDALETREDELVESMLERIRSEAPEALGGDDPAVVFAGRESCRGNIRVIFSALRLGREVPDDPPAAALEEARVCATAQIPLDALLQTYRIGHSVAWEASLDEADRRIDDVETRGKAVRLVSRFLFAYIDRTVPAVAIAYQRARESGFRDSERRKRQMVRDVLDELPVDESRWTYDLAGPHLALIGWGADPERAINVLAEAAGATPLTVPGSTDVVWGWLGGSELPARADEQLRRLAPEQGTYLAVGEIHDGVDGFRRTHKQAWRAYQVARARPRSITRYGEVALLALTMQDERLARAFVEEELGELAANDQRSAVLRETLLAYFACGQNAAAAAATLGVHDRTVAYRVRSVETKLGIYINDRRDELAVALRLAKVLPGRQQAE